MADKTKEKDDDTIEIEIEGEEVKKADDKKVAAKKDEDDVDVVDDTPEKDRNRKPVPKEEVDAFDKDELTEFEGKVKSRLIKAKRIYHDERRVKEAAMRERDEALDFARRIVEENKRLQANAARGDEALHTTFKSSAQLEMDAAKQEFKAAYEGGDAEKLAAAQEKISAAAIKIAQAANFKPTGQTQEKSVEQKIDAPVTPRLDPKTVAWQKQNTWWGTDPEMTATALGLHQRLEQQNGKQFVGSDDYWKTIDTTMRRRFPEYFEEEQAEEDEGKSTSKQAAKPATVVAPASRTTASKKIVLKQSQLAIAKKLGLTPEQYAKAQLKLEQN